MKYLILISATFFLNGCANMQAIDEAFTASNPDYKRSYPVKVGACLDAAKKSLKDLGAGVDEVRGQRLISDRWSFLNYAQASASGSAYSANATAVQYSIFAKLYVDFREVDKGQCEVRVAKVRAWENSLEYEKLDADNVLKLLVHPFFKNLDDQVTR